MLKTLTIGQGLREILAFWRGRRPTLREQFLEAKFVERLADLLADEEAKADAAAPLQPSERRRAKG
jgi:hypothetical protein